MLFAGIIESLVISSILCLAFVIIRKYTFKAGGQSFLARVSARKVIVVFFVLVFSAHLIYAQTFYGDSGSGSYKRIPLLKPYAIIYDSDRQYPSIYKSTGPNSRTQGTEITRVSEYTLSSDTLVAGLVPGHDQKTYFLLNMRNDEFHELTEADFAIYCAEHSLPNDMKDFQEQYKKYWWWHLNW
jgi:hypothetical protein